ncbi:cytochrome P450 [Planomonospora parontospora]|uniref:cytochrome P450 n=1 Tax=Planomonospora parontospora TaxID=58119 RepID=UPI00199B8098|nr:cytochrome P450 [Planomonospora parontospora]GGL48184.1 hypothetical protein GCM10014719_56860 [Planomonospora parontospora subsp. antibiotica]GII18772.1 hypothetical protein Ppa05_54980 [Planomonospora parontospora subsp. antibiotica]
MWPDRLSAEPQTLADVIERPYLLPFAYRRSCTPGGVALSPQARALICCLLRAAGHDPEAIRPTTASTHEHRPSSEDDTDLEVVAFVRHYYAADRSPLRRFASRVDTAYLKQHPEALSAVYQHHLTLVPEARWPLPVHVEERITTLLSQRETAYSWQPPSSDPHPHPHPHPDQQPRPRPRPEGDRTTVEYDPFTHALQEDPYPTYAWLRENAPLYRNDHHDFYALSRHADVRLALRDHALYSSSRGVSLEMWDVVAQQGLSAAELVGFIALDPPQHTRLRALVGRGFTRARVAALEPAIRAIIRQHLHRAWESSDGSFDFAETFTLIPMDVIAEILGIPAADRTMVRDMVIDVGQRQDGDTQLPMSFWESLQDLTTYYGHLIMERRAHPRDDLISTMATADLDGDRLTDQEIIASLLLINAAGTETVTKLAGNAWYQAWLHPEQQALAWEGNIDGWVNETLRYDGPAQALARELTRDTLLHGTLVPAGSRILLLGASANRDPRVFPDPDRYDLNRDTGSAIPFGGGPHFCLGAALARMQLRIALEELITAVDAYDIDPEGIRLACTTNLRGFAALPTTVKLR